MGQWRSWSSGPCQSLIQAARTGAAARRASTSVTANEHHFLTNLSIVRVIKALTSWRRGMRRVARQAASTCSTEQALYHPGLQKHARNQRQATTVKLADMHDVMASVRLCRSARVRRRSWHTIQRGVAHSLRPSECRWPIGQGNQATLRHCRPPLLLRTIAFYSGQRHAAPGRETP